MQNTIGMPGSFHTEHYRYARKFFQSRLNLDSVDQTRGKGIYLLWGGHT